jgi:chorismate synthase
MPTGMDLSEADIQPNWIVANPEHPATLLSARSRHGRDTFRCLSGKTTGTPIALLIVIRINSQQGLWQYH